MNHQFELKRIFVALPISFSLKEKILKFEKRFKKLNVRWIVPENLHITLVPPWYEKNIELVQQKLKGLEGSFCNFVVHFDLIEYGPNPQNPRLVWMVGDAPQELQNLRLKIFEELNQKPEDREFKTHITLARFYPNKKPSQKLQEKIFWTEEFREFVLMESILLKTGAEYKILEKIKLQNE